MIVDVKLKGNILLQPYNSGRLIQFAPCGTRRAVGHNEVVGVVKGWQDVIALERRKKLLFISSCKKRKHPMIQTVCRS